MFVSKAFGGNVVAGILCICEIIFWLLLLLFTLLCLKIVRAHKNNPVKDTGEL